MNTGEKFTTLNEKISQVHDMGVREGKKSAYDEFWDEFQDYGKRLVYNSAFHGSMSNDYRYGWTDKTYNPKYPIKTVPLYINNTYNYNTQITDTKVDIEINGDGDIATTFSNNYNLDTIRLLRLIGNHAFKNTFYNCRSLKNITIEGEITGSINFQHSPLTIESLKSIITHLKNCKGTENDLAYTLTLSADSKTLLESDTSYPEGSSWSSYITDYLGWNLL